METYKDRVRRQDASFEPLAASVGPTDWSVAMHKMPNGEFCTCAATPPLNRL